jgi:type I restriction enzyme, S subunit
VAKVSAVTWGTYSELESKTCLDPEKIEERYLIRPGDFLFSRANTIELVGACVITHNVTLRVMLSDKLLRFRFAPSVLPSWVLYWLRSDFGRHEIERLATGNQESMRNIGQERIRQIKFKVPPLAQQIRILAEVERRLSVVDELESVVKANLHRATRLRQSILRKAFSEKSPSTNDSDEHSN